MPDNNNIKIYLASDIERYHSGKMTAEERHAIEKAALDDPFLADAMEGYSSAEPASIPGDIDFIKKKLNERVGGGRIIAMPVRNKTSFQLMRVAAMLLIVAGLGWVVYEVAFNKPPEEVAAIKNKSATSSSKDSNQFINVSPVPSNTKDEASSLKKGNDPVTRTARTNISNHAVNADTTNKNDIVNRDVAISSKLLTAESLEKDRKSAEGAAREIERNSNAPGALQKVKKLEDKDAIENAFQTKSAPATPDVRQKINSFRGQVSDANNNPLPFVNISGTRDLNTYTDANGNFTLISPDSILNVQVKSLGFENKVAQLRNDVQENRVVLKQEQGALNEIIANKTEYSRAFGKSRLGLDEPEPVDGRNNYDVYLANNLKPPGNSGIKWAPGEVVISFDVTRKGRATNIKVEKSLCAGCDQEAIRLVKEGPKWKRKNKKTRGTVIVRF